MNVWSVDGYTLGKNPSDTGGGYVVFKNTKHIKTEEILKNPFTNNEAELLAIAYATSLADEGDIVETDSLIAYYWVRNGKAKARPDLNIIASMAHQFIKQKNLLIKQVKRSQNLAGIYIEDAQRQLELIGL